MVAYERKRALEVSTENPNKRELKVWKLKTYRIGNPRVSTENPNKRELKV